MKTTKNIETMKTVSHNNRNYEVVRETSVSNYPNIAKSNKNITHTFIATGKGGAMVSGYFFSDGTYTVTAY